MEDTKAASSSSVHPLETIGEWLQVTQGQLKLFGQDIQAREAILVAFGLSNHPGLMRRGANIAFCCRSPLIHEGAKGLPVLSLQTCKDRMCPRCQRARGIQLTRKVKGLVVGFNAPRFLTLTLQHKPAESLRSMLDRLAKAFRSLRAERFWKENVTRGIYTVEVTWNAAKGEWHAHLHAITDGEFMAHARLKELWCKASGGSTIVHIEAVHDRDRQASYIARYVAKPCDGHTWKEEQLNEFALATHGRRMVHTFGKAHGKPIDSPLPEEKKVSFSPLCSLRALLVEAAGGCRIAVEACEKIPRMGLRWCLAAGLAPPSLDADTLPVTEEELRSFVAACRTIAERIAERDLPKASEVPHAPPKKNSGTTRTLFPLHLGSVQAEAEELELPV